MVDIIYIPTKLRPDTQITYDNLPPHWQEKVILVVNADEDLSVYDEKYNIEVCGPEVDTFPKAKKFCVYHAGDRKFCILDDDLNFGVSFMKGKTDEGWARKPTPEDFDELFKIMSEMLDKYSYGSLKESNYPPSPDKNGVYPMWCFNGRVVQSVFYNGATMLKDEIDWTSNRFAEDHYTNIQMLLHGKENFICQKFMTQPGIERNQKGGCTPTRTLERHNYSWEQLAEKYPDFVKLRQKFDKNDGGMRTMGTIAWKKLAKAGKSGTYVKTKQQTLF